MLVITYYINGGTGVSHVAVPEKQVRFFGKSRTLIWGDVVTRCLGGKTAVKERRYGGAVRSPHCTRYRGLSFVLLRKSGIAGTHR